MATATPPKTAGSGTPAPRPPRPRRRDGGQRHTGGQAPKAPPLGRAMVWAGLAAGTAITVLAVMHGIRIPGLQVVLSVLATWVLLMVLAVTAAELARRHHRAAARHAWRHGKRGARFARHHSRPRRPLAVGPAGQQSGRPLGQPRAPAAHVHPRQRAAAAAGGPFTPVLLTARSTSGRVLNPVTGEPHATVLVKDPEDLKRRLAAAARYPDIEVSTRPADPPGGNESNPPEGTSTMADTTVTDDSTKGWDDPLPGPGTPGPGKARARRPTGASYSAAWKQVVADTSEFEPEDDGHLLGWMAAEVNGMSAYAEAMTEVYETCVNTVGLDPVAMKATARRRRRRRGRAPARWPRPGPSSPPTTAKSASSPPAAACCRHDGRWITGDGDA